MKHAFLCGILVLIFLSQSCSHYVSEADPSVATDDDMGADRSVFLAIRAEVMYPLDEYAVTMDARHGRDGPVVESLRRSYLYINGVKRGLQYGFPYQLSSTPIVLPIGTSELEIGFQGPCRPVERARFALAPRLSYKRTFSASRTSGLVVTISPALGQDEIVELTVYRSVGTFKRIASRVFQGLGLSTLNVAATDFAAQIQSDGEMTVELDRKRVTFRNVLFSDGIELSQSQGSVFQYVTVKP
ncbi:MAG: hypothetical protein ACK47W_04815 [Bacteroidota bacterium]